MLIRPLTFFLLTMLVGTTPLYCQRKAEGMRVSAFGSGKYVGIEWTKINNTGDPPFSTALVLSKNLDNQSIYGKLYRELGVRGDRSAPYFLLAAIGLAGGKPAGFGAAVRVRGGWDTGHVFLGAFAEGIVGNKQTFGDIGINLGLHW